jgi:hypothetical protein
MDENVHFSLSMKVANALIEENKDFDMLIVPNTDHSGACVHSSIEPTGLLPHCALRPYSPTRAFMCALAAVLAAVLAVPLCVLAQACEVLMPSVACGTTLSCICKASCRRRSMRSAEVASKRSRINYHAPARIACAKSSDGASICRRYARTRSSTCTHTVVVPSLRRYAVYIHYGNQRCTQGSGRHSSSVACCCR